MQVDGAVSSPARGWVRSLAPAKRDALLCALVTDAQAIGVRGARGSGLQPLLAFALLAATRPAVRLVPTFRATRDPGSAHALVFPSHDRAVPRFADGPTVASCAIASERHARIVDTRQTGRALRVVRPEIEGVVVVVARVASLPALAAGPLFLPVAGEPRAGAACGTAYTVSGHRRSEGATDLQVVFAARPTWATVGTPRRGSARGTGRRRVRRSSSDQAPKDRYRRGVGSGDRCRRRVSPSSSWWRERQSELALASLHKCLFGPPLGPDERPSGRVRRILLAGEAEGWPQRCTRYHADLTAALDGDLARYVDAGVQGAPDVEAASEGRTGVTQRFDVFYSNRPKRPAPADVPSAPPDPKLLDETTPLLIPRATLLGASTNRSPGRDLRLLAEGTLCTFSATLESARCASAQSAHGKPRQILGSEDGAAPLLLVAAASARDLAVRGDTGEVVCDHEVLGGACPAYAHADGQVTRLQPRLHKATRSSVLQRRGKQPSAELTLAPESGVVVLKDRAYWVAGEGDAARLWRADVGVEPPAAAVEVGRLPSGRELRACRLQDAWVFHVHQEREHDLVFVPDRGPAKDVHFSFDDVIGSFDSQPAQLACGESDAVHRRRAEFDTNGYIVRWARCTSTGCAKDNLVFDGLFGKASVRERPGGIFTHEVRASGLGGKLLVVWRSQRAGIRLRHAAPEAIAHAKDVIAYDDRLDGGAVSGSSMVHEDFLLVSRPHAAMLLLSTLGQSSGIHALRIGVDSAVTAVRLDGA